MRVPFLKEKRVCHDEKEKAYKLEQRRQPKQVESRFTQSIVDRFTMLRNVAKVYMAFLHLARNVVPILKDVARKPNMNVIFPAKKS